MHSFVNLPCRASGIMKSVAGAVGYNSLTSRHIQSFLVQTFSFHRHGTVPPHMHYLLTNIYAYAILVMIACIMSMAVAHPLTEDISMW